MARTNFSTLAGVTVATLTSLTRPGMTMQVANVGPGSPAEPTDKRPKVQIIGSINSMRPA